LRYVDQAPLLRRPPAAAELAWAIRSAVVERTAKDIGTSKAETAFVELMVAYLSNSEKKRSVQTDRYRAINLRASFARQIMNRLEQHDPILMTEKYAHLALDNLRSAIARLDTPRHVAV
jgi:hypothetical protein